MRNDYAAAGVPLYWRIEIAPELEVHTYELAEAKTYRAAGRHTGRLHADKPWSISVDLGSFLR